VGEADEHANRNRVREGKTQVKIIDLLKRCMVPSISCLYAIERFYPVRFEMTRFDKASLACRVILSEAKEFCKRGK